MFDTVVIPLAWGDVADTVVAHGAAVASQAGAAIELLTVRSPYDSDAGARRRLTAVARAHEIDAIVRTVQAEDPAAVLASVGSEPGKLLCLRSHARRPLAELALGSVSARVVRTCRRPVLLVGPHCQPAPPTYESLITALDGSDLAGSILPVVTDWCRHLDLTPWLFEVLSARVPFELGAGDVQEAVYVHRVAYQLGLEGFKVGWDTAHDRHVAAAISRFADSRRPAILALSTHGRSGLGHLALGSVAMAVTHQATCPVLVHRPEPATREELS